MSETISASPVTAAGGDGFIAAGRMVGAGRGWDWIASGWALFVRQPGVWIGITLAWLVFTAVSHFIAPLGLVNIVISPVLIGGLMLGTQALATDGTLTFNHLFAGFSKKFGSLLALGLLYFGSLIVIVVIAGAIMGLGVLQAMAAGDMAQVMASGMTVLLGLLVALALLVPVAMLLWFAPALIVLQDVGVGGAMGASFAGCLKNVIPFLVYGIVLFFPMIIATLPMGLGWLILGPVIIASTYVAYRDIFFSR